MSQCHLRAVRWVLLHGKIKVFVVVVVVVVVAAPVGFFLVNIESKTRNRLDSTGLWLLYKVTVIYAVAVTTGSYADVTNILIAFSISIRTLLPGVGRTHDSTTTQQRFAVMGARVRSLHPTLGAGCANRL